MFRTRVALIRLVPFFALTVLSAAVAVPIPAGAATPDAAAPDARITWSSCDAFECGTLQVPLDYQAPEAPTIELAVVRRPADDPANRIGALVVNPGGPGAPAVSFLRAVASSYPRPLRERFDLVAFDPRGVGKSSPVRCSTSLDPLFDQSFSPRTDAEREALIDAARTVASECMARSGPVLEHVSTQNTARDLERLRVALKERRINFLGSSYGSYLGAVYITFFPDRVRAFVLDGAIDPEQTAAEATVGQAKGFENELNAFFVDCDKRPECAFRSDRNGGSAAAYDALRSRSARAPLTAKDSGGRRLNETRFDAAVLETLYAGRDGWRSLAAALATADGGDASALLRQADAFTWRRADGTHDHVLDAFWAISCLDGPVPDQLGPLLLERLAALSAPRLGAFIANTSVICSVWPVPPVPPPPSLTAVGAPTVLIVGATKDPATPLAAGREMRRELGNARLLSVEADRHTSFNAGNECVDDAVTGYLVDRRLPRPGTRC